MATTLSKTQIDRRAAAESVAASVKTAKPAPIAKESVLCDLFIEAFDKIDGWTCYPEGAGFDVLVVHEDGRQIGVEAKLSLNAKVCEAHAAGGLCLQLSAQSNAPVHPIHFHPLV